MNPQVTAISVTVLTALGCSSEGPGDRGARGGMRPAPMASRPAPDPRAPRGVQRPRPRVSPAAAQLYAILAKNRELAKIMEEIKSLSDLEGRRRDYVRLNVEVLRLTVASRRRAVKLPPDQLEAYVARDASVGKALQRLGRRMVEAQKRILQMKGAQRLLAEIQQELARRIRPLSKDLGAISREYRKKAAAAKQRRKPPDRAGPAVAP